MTINRTAALDYAKKFWNRVCDDDKFWTSDAPVSLAAKRREMNASAKDGWEAFFVSNGTVGENAVFRRTVKGKVEQMPDPIAEWDALDDCTHYVSRCLLAEGVKLTETPRANELTESMMKSKVTKTLALQVTQAEGQKVVDSGIFKTGDMVGYFTPKKSRYTHTAMFVGRQAGGDKDPGGITCHTVCRFEGQSKAWNGADDDAWFLGGDHLHTLIHFSDDDAAVSADTINWLPGWWKVGRDLYHVTEDGHATSALQLPAKAGQLPAVQAKGYYFEAGKEIVFIWRRQQGKIQVERWTKPAGKAAPGIMIDGVRGSAARMESNGGHP